MQGHSQDFTLVGGTKAERRRPTNAFLAYLRPLVHFW